LEKAEAVRKGLLLDVTPYMDFVITIPTAAGEPVDVLHSIFLSRPSQECLRIIEESLRDGKELRSEGITRLVSIEDIAQRRVEMAYGAGLILGYFTKKRLPPHRRGTKLEALGIPRASYSEYLRDFRYTCEAIKGLNPR